MNLLDILILALIAAALVLAWRVSRKRKGGCGCSGCSGCTGSCQRCDECRKVCDAKEQRKGKS